MNYLVQTPNLKKSFKKTDLLAAFVANIIHDYEHPGYSNSFVVRTKHPLAIRYSDMYVLENHHLAAAFNVMQRENSNILKNVSHEVYRETRSLIIDVVLGTDMSKHFTLLTELKTKLGNNFPTDSYEDRKLLITTTLRVSDLFKFVR